MAYWTHTQAPMGVFTECDAGRVFEYSVNDTGSEAPWDFPHRVWVGGVVNDQGWRYATVKKTVAYVVVDEDEHGDPVIEKWQIRGHKEYAL